MQRMRVGTKWWQRDRRLSELSKTSCSLLSNYKKARFKGSIIIFQLVTNEAIEPVW